MTNVICRKTNYLSVQMKLKLLYMYVTNMCRNKTLAKINETLVTEFKEYHSGFAIVCRITNSYMYL